MHDCGEIGIYNDILGISNHALFGFNIVNNLPEDEELEEGVLYHHENWDGTGYPEGLLGLKIPLIARIINIADAYQILVSDQLYSDALSTKESIKKIIANKGILHDPNLVDMFIDMLEDK